MAHAVLPEAEALARTLSKLIGRDVRGKPNKTPALPAFDKVFVAAYDDGSGGLEALWLAELPLTAAFGASLTLVPAGVATEAVRAQKLPPELEDNAKEVANITANSFLERRVRLTQFWAPKAALPEPIVAFAKAKGSLLETSLEVAGYGGGKLWLVGHVPAPS